VASAKGVQPGKTEVLLSGVSVGLVEDARLVRGRPVLTLALEEKFGPLHRDASAHIGSATPFQDMYVAVKRGQRSSGRLPDGGTLDAANSSVTVEPGDILNTFNADTRARLATLLNELGRGLPGGGLKLRAAFAELTPLMDAARDVTRELAVRRRAVARLMHNFAGLTETLGRRDRELAVLVDAGNASLAELARRDTRLAETVSELEPTLVAARAAFAELQQAEAELDPAFRSLRPAATRLEPGMAALARFAESATPALRRLRPAAVALGPLARVARPTAAALGRGFSELRPRTPSIDRLTSAIVPCLTPLQRLVQRFPSANKFGNRKGSYWRIQVTYGPDTVGGTVRDPAVRPIETCAEEGT
jgi:phospholipid/cholesterol/gamma-HCH transport system substrate-binding protein